MQTTEGRAGRVRVEQGAKRVRAYLGGEVVADTIRPRLVWEIPHYPACYLPVEDVRTELLAPTARPWRASCSRTARMPGVHSAGCRSRKPCLR
jgi:uncharacterized protein (DUF427 family)